MTPLKADPYVFRILVNTSEGRSVHIWTTLLPLYPVGVSPKRTGTIIRRVYRLQCIVHRAKIDVDFSRNTIKLLFVVIKCVQL